MLTLDREDSPRSLRSEPCQWRSDWVARLKIDTINEYGLCRIDRAVRFFPFRVRNVMRRARKSPGASIHGRQPIRFAVYAVMPWGTFPPGAMFSLE